MDNKYLNEVQDRLENYQKMMRQIELLQYEIQYASHVTPTEMIEVMTFQKRDADNAGTNAYPKSVPEIAMSYQRAAAQLNGESVEELISNTPISAMSRIGFRIRVSGRAAAGCDP